MDSWEKVTTAQNAEINWPWCAHPPQLTHLQDTQGSENILEEGVERAREPRNLSVEEKEEEKVEKEEEEETGGGFIWEELCGGIEVNMIKIQYRTFSKNW